MTIFAPITETEARITYTATASQTTFPYDFLISAEGDEKVFVDGTEKTLTTDYTITGTGQLSGGNIVFNSGLTGGEFVVITRETVASRATGYTTAGDFKASAINQELARILNITQDVRRVAERSLSAPDSIDVASGGFTLPIPEDGKVLQWSGTTGTVVNGPNAAEISGAAASATAAAASASAASTDADDADTARIAAEAARDEAQAAVGGVVVSANDTTPGNLEAKVVVGTGLTRTTNNEGANETLTIGLDSTGIDPWDSYDGSFDTTISEIADYTATLGGVVRSKGIALTDTLAIIAMLDATNEKVYCVAVTRSGDTLTYGSLTDCMTAGTSWDSGADENGFELVKVSDTKFLISALDTTGTDFVEYNVCSVSGTTITAGTKASVQHNGSNRPYAHAFAYLEDDKLFFASIGSSAPSFSLTGRVATVSGTVVTMQTEVLLENSSTGGPGFNIMSSGYCQALPFNGGSNVMVLFQTDNTAGTDKREYYQQVSISGNTVTAVTDSIWAQRSQGFNGYNIAVQIPRTDKFVEYLAFMIREWGDSSSAKINAQAITSWAAGAYAPFMTGLNHIWSRQAQTHIGAAAYIGTDNVVILNGWTHSDPDDVNAQTNMFSIFKRAGTGWVFATSVYKPTGISNFFFDSLETSIIRMGENHALVASTRGEKLTTFLMKNEA